MHFCEWHCFFGASKNSCLRKLTQESSWGLFKTSLAPSDLLLDTGRPPLLGALCRLPRCGSTTGTVILVEGDSNGAQSMVGYHHWPVLCPPLVAAGSCCPKIRAVPGASPDTSSKYPRVYVLEMTFWNHVVQCYWKLCRILTHFDARVTRWTWLFFLIMDEMFRWLCDRRFVW